MLFGCFVRHIFWTLRLNSKRYPCCMFGHQSRKKESKKKEWKNERNTLFVKIYRQLKWFRWRKLHRQVIQTYCLVPMCMQWQYLNYILLSFAQKETAATIPLVLIHYRKYSTDIVYGSMLFAIVDSIKYRLPLHPTWHANLEK